jgi:hypothetical protein
VAPTVTDINFAGAAAVSISIKSTAGLNYYLEAKTNLDDSIWTVLTTGLTGTGGAQVLTDTNAIVPRRFYRIRAQ